MASQQQLSSQKEQQQSTALAPANDQRIAQARRVDEIASSAMTAFQQAGSIDARAFELELAVAQSVSDLRLALTPELMAPIMALQNTDLGFRTDRDPNQTDRQTGKPFVPYPVEIVRECFIEAKLRGFRSVGNEWNILAGRFYAAKNGLRRKVQTWPGLTDLKDSYDPPRLVGDRGAVVKCRATWRKDGVPDSLPDTDIPIKVNSFMGSDAILGKAERKLLKRVHDRLSGISTPEGEAGEVDDQPQVMTAPPAPASSAAETGAKRVRRPVPEDIRQQVDAAAKSEPAAEQKKKEEQRRAEDEAALEAVGRAVVDAAEPKPNSPDDVGARQAAAAEPAAKPAPTPAQPSAASSAPAAAKSDRPIDAVVARMYEVTEKRQELGAKEARAQLDKIASEIAGLLERGETTKEERGFAEQEYRYCRDLIAGKIKQQPEGGAQP